MSSAHTVLYWVIFFLGFGFLGFLIVWLGGLATNEAIASAASKNIYAKRRHLRTSRKFRATAWAVYCATIAVAYWL